MTKRNTLLISGLISITIITINYLGTYAICNSNRDCAHLLTNIIWILYIFVPLFLLSLITYKMQDEIFHKWLKFVYIWVPLTIILVLISPEYGNSLFPIEKDSVSFFMSVLFLLISIILILSNHFSLKNSHN